MKRPAIREFATFRLPKELKNRCVALAEIERRPLSKMLEILVEEALDQRMVGYPSSYSTAPYQGENKA